LELRESGLGEAPVLVPSSTDGYSVAPCPPDLARVVDAWGQLPDAIKAGILALVDAGRSSAGGGHE
jgi:hypothetical protein